MSIVRFQMFQDVGGGTPPPSTVSFTYTGPTAIDPGSNFYLIPVSGITTPYVAGELLSVEYNLTATLEDLESYIYIPDLNASAPTLFSFSSAGSGANISGASMVNTIFYNSSVQVYPSIESSSSPYTGTWTDNYDGSSFDDSLVGILDTLIGDWQVYIENYSASTYTLNSVTLTFAL